MRRYKEGSLLKGLRRLHYALSADSPRSGTGLHHNILCSIQQTAEMPAPLASGSKNKAMKKYKERHAVKLPEQLEEEF
jgi:hypothetical protein